MTKFYENDLSLDTLWRAIVLIGKNNKTYKFALAKSILNLAKEGKQEITMKELSPLFADVTVEHVRNGLQQGVDNNRKGEFLTACEKFSNNEITKEQLYTITEKKAFGDVIERFHTVNNAQVDKSFYDWSSFKKDKKIIIRDEIFNLLQSEHGSSLLHEVEARWNLVEHAWDIGIDPKLLDVEYDEETKLFYLNKNSFGKTRRVNVANSRDALNGYQKGHCFFCFDNISVNANEDNTCHVDHFFPHSLFDRTNNNINYNGVWNLVLACQSCNSSKLAKYPDKRFLERLHNRNEFYVTSHLPLKESILKIGNNEKTRISFLQKRFNEAKELLVSVFDVHEKREARF